MDVEYRTAKKEELEQLISQIREGKFEPLNPLESKSVHQDLQNLKTKDYLVAVEKKKILGFARFKKISEDRTHIGIFSIKKEHRLKGVGKRLLEHIEKKINTPNLTVGTYSSRSVDWFKKRGFKIRAEKCLHPELKVSLLEKRL